MIELFTSATAFIFFELVTHPKSNIRKKMPMFKIKRLELYPCLRLHLQTKVIHIHHWIYWSAVLLISIPTHYRLLDSAAVQGFMLGSAIQGFLINKKSRQIIFSLPLERSDEYR